MNILDKISAGVGDATDIPAAATRLLQNIAAELRVATGNSDGGREFANMIGDNAGHLSRLVIANTPMVLATPAVHPHPGAGAGAPDKLDTISMTGTSEEISEWLGDHQGLKEVYRRENEDKSATAYFVDEGGHDEGPREAI